MKRLHGLCLLLLTIASTVAGSRPVVLEISYMVGNKPFVPDSAFLTSDGIQTIQLTRFQFYLSAFRLVASNGDEELLRESVVLANALQPSSQFIGTTDKTDITQVKFGIGVPPIYNHLDPSTYPAGHPLGHQEPSMHWGWTAGYRFVVLEGLARQENGSNQHFEIHTVDDSLYRQSTATATLSFRSDTLVVSIQAFVDNVLNGIPVYAGIINHSAEGEAITVMNTMASIVFNNKVTSVEQSTQPTAFTLWPNPTPDQCSMIVETNGTLTLLDVTGNTVRTLHLNAGPHTIVLSDLPAGWYNAVFTTPTGTKASQSIMRCP